MLPVRSSSFSLRKPVTSMEETPQEPHASSLQGMEASEKTQRGQIAALSQAAVRRVIPPSKPQDALQQIKSHRNPLISQLKKLGCAPAKFAKAHAVLGGCINEC